MKKCKFSTKGLGCSYLKHQRPCGGENPSYCDLWNNQIKEEKKDYHYSVDVKYDESRSCSESGCDEEGICRCGKIHNARVEKIESSFVGEFDLDNDFDKYIFERIIRLLDRNGKLNWEVNVSGGYYGQEIESVHLLNEEVVLDALSSLKSMTSDAEKLKWVLTEEYGHIPDHYKFDKIEIVDVPAHLLIYQKTYGGYRVNKDRPVCIVRQEGKKFRVIDGNHRVNFVKMDQRNKTIKVIKIGS